MSSNIQPADSARWDLSPANYKKALVYLALLGLVIRLLYLVEHVHSPSYGVPTLDQKYYDMVARMLLAGEDLHPLHGLRPLLYPLFLAAMYRVGGAHGVDVALVTQHLLGVATGILVALMGTRLFGRRICGIVGGALYLLAPVPLCFEGELLIEPFYTFLICLALLLHLRAAEAPSGRSCFLWFIGGALIALIAQARANILVFLAVYPPLTVCRCWRERKITVAAFWPLIALAGALAMAIPWGVYNMRQADHFHLIPNAGGVNLYLGNKRASDGMVPAQDRRVTSGERYEDSVEVWARQEYAAAMRAEGRAPDADPMAVSKYWTTRAIAEIKAAPAAWLGLIVKKSWLTLWNAEIPNNKSFAFFQLEFPLLRLLPVRWVILLMLAPAGIWAAARSGARDKLLIVLAYTALYLAANVAFFICDRYRYPVWPAMAALAGGGLLAVWDAFRRGPPRLAASLGASMALMAAISTPNWFHAQLPNFARDYLFRSIAWYEKGHFAEALEDIDRSLQLDPLDANALQQRGNTLLALGRFAEARPAFEATLKLAPEDGSVWNNYGASLEALGQTNEAVQAYTRATQCAPPSRNAFLALAFLHLRAKQTDEAASWLDHLSQSAPGPDDAEVLALRSVIARRRGDTARANELEAQARKLDDGATSWALGRVSAAP